MYWPIIWTHTPSGNLFTACFICTYYLGTAYVLSCVVISLDHCYLPEVDDSSYWCHAIIYYCTLTWYINDLCMAQRWTLFCHNISTASLVLTKVGVIWVSKTGFSLALIKEMHVHLTNRRRKKYELFMTKLRKKKKRKKSKPLQAMDVAQCERRLMYLPLISEMHFTPRSRNCHYCTRTTTHPITHVCISIGAAVAVSHSCWSSSVSWCPAFVVCCCIQLNSV